MTSLSWGRSSQLRVDMRLHSPLLLALRSADFVPPSKQEWYRRTLSRLSCFGKVSDYSLAE